MREQDPSPVDMIPPVLSVEPAEPAAVPVVAPVPPPRRPGPVALGLFAIGFGLAIAAQYMPWSSVKTGAGNGADPDTSFSPSRTLPTSIDIDLANLTTGHVVIYLTTVVLTLVAIAVLLAVTGAAQRAAAAAAGGLLAGNLLVLVGFKSAIDNVGVSPYVSYSLPEDAVTFGAGYLLAYASVLVLAVGVIVAMRGPLLAGRIARRSRAADQPDGGEPLELTVTALPSSSLH